MWTTHIITSQRWTTHIMFQDQVNHICINFNLALYYICIEIMLQKLSFHMAIIQNSQSKSYIYVCPLYIYSSYPLFRCHCQCLRRILAALFRLVTGDPHRWTRGIGHINGDCRKTKFCKLIYQPLKILCIFVQIPNQYNIFTYCMWVSNGGSWCLTNTDPNWALFKHDFLTIKLH